MPDDDQQPGPQIPPDKPGGSEPPSRRRDGDDREDPNGEEKGSADPDHPDSF